MKGNNVDIEPSAVLPKETAVSLSDAEITELLNNRRQRALLSALQMHEKPVDIETVIEQVTQQESYTHLGDIPVGLADNIATASGTHTYRCSLSMISSDANSRAGNFDGG